MCPPCDRAPSGDLDAVRLQRDARLAGLRVLTDLAARHGISEDDVAQLRASAARSFAARRALLEPDDELEIVQLQAERALATCAELLGRMVARGADYQQTLTALRAAIGFHAQLQQARTPADLGL